MLAPAGFPGASPANRPEDNMTNSTDVVSPDPPRPTGCLDGLGFEFSETMSGSLAPGQTDPQSALEGGQGQASRFDVQIEVDDLGLFLREAEHAATLQGTVTVPFLGGTFHLRDGIFNLFAIDEDTGRRKMIYAFHFTAAGQTYYLYGHKDIHDDRAWHPVQDLTTLFTVIHKGETKSAPVIAAGLLHFDLKDAPALVASMKVVGPCTTWQKVAAYAAFASFAWGVMRDEYLADVRLLYDTHYENLVLSGHLLDAARPGEQPFFFVAGVHERGFPWGDSGIFWDVLLLVGDGKGGFDRYCITDHALQGLHLDIATGSCHYRGPLFRLPTGTTTSFSSMRKREAPLVPCQADIALSFAATSYDDVMVSFPLVPKLVRKLNSALVRELEALLPGEDELGINIRPHGVRLRSGQLSITEPPGAPRGMTVVQDKTFGEAEIGRFRNVREPTMLYGYLCALRPAEQAARVQIHSDVLREHKEKFAKDRLEAFLGAVIARTSSSEMLLQDGKLSVAGIAPPGLPFDRARELKTLGDPLLDVRNDQFPTGVFHRRIVRVLDPSGVECLALEEAMSLMRLEAIRSSRKVTVAALRSDRETDGLDRVLAETGFDAILDAKLAQSGKTKEQFLVSIKPNFMFAYDKRDHSTYTDPALVHHLVARLQQRGYSRIRVVEAQSAYGEYFDHRSVNEMADYLGYDGSPGYQVVDMTLDANEKQYLGPHLGLHPVSRVWKESDFRIVFAKNKTHAYAYYTLGLKCIYGALPLADKFREYHCKRGIYATAIEYLAAFPVDYGLIDAYASADGPFGVFADPQPRDTRTILGSSDLVALDWVGASKMGINPMLSQHMQRAVEVFGKPAIDFVGDPTPYRPWLNVPVAVTAFANKLMDGDHAFGNFLYAAAAQMDETHFTYKNRSAFMRLVRWTTIPLRRTFFVRAGEDPTWANRLACWIVYKLGF